MNEEHHLVINISWKNLPARLRLRVALALGFTALRSGKE